jgi:hypothetical protein
VLPSEIIAHECLAILGTPLLVPFLREVRMRDESWCSTQLERLTARLGWTVPEIWSERINLKGAPALYRRLMRGETVTLDMLLRSPTDRTVPLDCEVLYLDRDDDDHLLMPAGNTSLRPGDELLLAGTRRARSDLGLGIGNEHTLAYLITGEDLPGGWIWLRLARRGRRSLKPILP